MPKDHFLFYTIISSYFIDCPIFDNIWLNWHLLRGAVIGETGETVVTPGFQELICHFQNCKAKVCRTIGSKVTGNLVLPGFNSWRRPCYYIMSEANIDFFVILHENLMEKAQFTFKSEYFSNIFSHEQQKSTYKFLIYCAWENRLPYFLI